MDRRPPVLAPSALGYGPPVRNWFEEERGSVFLRTLHYLKHNTPKTLNLFYLVRAVFCGFVLSLYFCLTVPKPLNTITLIYN